jgi:hypothetical protein
MAGIATAMEEFVDDFERYITFVDETRAEINAALVNLRDTTFEGSLGSKFEDLVRADVQGCMATLHEEFSTDLVQLRADIEYVRALEARGVNI